ncbi:MAG: arginine--tRNA ligase [Anaerolineales bacterium]|nr:arginine--tRNA ligase [Anaerolineales bacterium]MCB8939376.1 arginine--tRNA ligase [Ardenticatenaceae bacterium]
MTVHHQLAAVLQEALQAAQTAGALPSFDPPEITIERPRDVAFGDYASPTPLKLARDARMAPIKIAQAIVDHLPATDYIEEVTVAPPGFINIRLTEARLQQVLEDVLNEGDAYGRIHLGDGKKAQIECVSANPTGPIHIGRTRGGVMGDTLARAMRLAGYEVVLEYYYNDAGRQVTMLGESTKIRYLQLLGQDAELGPDHYKGDYITDIARELYEAHGDTLQNEPTDYFGNYAKDKISQSQKETLRRINIVFDVYYNEQSLYETGRVWEALETLQQKGYVYAQDNAQWFKTTEFGDEKDRVLVKQTGEPTYRMPDIAYHWDKAQRGFDLVVDIFGPDHHATAPQVLMGVQALGYPTDFVRTVLHQIISIIRDGQEVKMSTRAGTFVALDDILDEVGPDPIRYFMISRSGNSPIDFDLNLALEKSDKNPVYYIQNAHVRCAGIFRKWAEAGGDPEADADADLSLLTHENELAFMRKAMELTAVVEQMTLTSEPHHIAFYAYDLAAAFHPTYEKCRVLSDDVPEPLRRARLHFYRAAQRLFAHVLSLMGMSAPEVM